MDFVITVCDQAAGEICPVWPGRPVAAHWGVPDPAAASGCESEHRQAFRDAIGALEQRVRRLVDLPLEKLDSSAAQRALQAIAAPATTPSGNAM